jgi:NADPH:quinone reductase-like Zn-dependent oxidoreductase
VKMKAIVVSQYGGPEVLEYKDFPDPSPGPDEVLVRVAAASINPFDLKRRSGEAKAFAPINFPGVLGVDVAGTVISCGEQVTGGKALGSHLVIWTNRLDKAASLRCRRARAVGFWRTVAALQLRVTSFFLVVICPQLTS